ncbi:hypothetical protein Bbelb_118320 [Branchiostoma belcheri]|nr:hypothetical protein Bbelb_118320 [Branchiostoma belcheri]
MSQHSQVPVVPGGGPGEDRREQCSKSRGFTEVDRREQCSKPPGLKEVDRREQCSKPPGLKEVDRREQCSKPPGLKEVDRREQCSKPPGLKEEDRREQCSKSPGLKEEDRREQCSKQVAGAQGGGPPGAVQQGGPPGAVQQVAGAQGEGPPGAVQQVAGAQGEGPPGAVQQVAGAQGGGPPGAVQQAAGAQGGGPPGAVQQVAGAQGGGPPGAVQQVAGAQGGGPPGAVQQVAGAQGGGPPDDPWMANTTTTPTTPTPNTNNCARSGTVRDSPRVSQNVDLPQFRVAHSAATPHDPTKGSATGELSPRGLSGPPNSPRARLPRSGNLHQRAKGSCGPENEFWIPGEMFSKISKADKQGKKVRIEGGVKQELEYWKFLDTWQGHMPWKPERHEVVNLTTDASAASSSLVEASCDRGQGPTISGQTTRLDVTADQVGPLRAIFNERGRGGDWDERLGLGNPAASQDVRKFKSSDRRAIATRFNSSTGEASVPTKDFGGESQKGIMEHVGWFRKRTASYYMKVAQVMEPGRPAQKLASPEVTQATERYERSNQVADDTSLYNSATTVQAVANTTNTDLQLVSTWFMDWGLQLHPDKCKVLCVKSDRKNVQLPPLYLLGKIVEQVPFYSHLGVTIHQSTSLRKSQLLLICSSRGVPTMPPLTLGGDLVPVTSVAKGLGFTFDSNFDSNLNGTPFHQAKVQLTGNHVQTYKRTSSSSPTVTRSIHKRCPVNFKAPTSSLLQQQSGLAQTGAAKRVYLNLEYLQDNLRLGLEVDGQSVKLLACWHPFLSVLGNNFRRAFSKVATLATSEVNDLVAGAPLPAYLGRMPTWSRQRR